MMFRVNRYRHKCICDYILSITKHSNSKTKIIEKIE